MLKLQYSETGLFMERVTLSLEGLIAQRVVLAVRFGQPLSIQPGRASFLLPIETAGLSVLLDMLQLPGHGHISVAPVDDEYVEVAMQGTWMAQDATAEEGTFVTIAPDRTEFYLYKLWQATQVAVSYLA